MQKLKVHESKRYLMHEDGTPFFYLGDTAWDLFQRLNREEIEFFLSARAKQEFTVIQCVLANGCEPFDWPNKLGRFALKEPYDKLDYNEKWWQLVDYAVDCAEKYGLYMGFLPMWGNKYDEPETTLFKDYDAAFSYGKFLGERYRDKVNIIWIFGGDIGVKPYMHEIYEGLAAGIKAGEREDNHHLITFHPGGGSNTVDQLGEDKDYLDFLSSQSGHGVDGAYEPYKLFNGMKPVEKPYLDTEAHYEDHPANWQGDFKKWDGADIRQGAYESVFDGACGETYGNSLIAFFIQEPVGLARSPFFVGDYAEDSHEQQGWPGAIRHEGAETIKYLKRLRLSRPYFDFRPAPEMVLNSKDDQLFGRICAARGKDYAFIYSPIGREIKVDCSMLDAKYIRASWFNPRTGEEKEICYLTARKAIFVPETRGKGQDWVLVLDGGKRDWKEIGQIIQVE